MNRMVTDRLWPVLLALVVLLVGALGLERVAMDRVSDPTVIAIHEPAAGLGSGDEDDDTALETDDEVDVPLSDTHRRAREAARRAELPHALELFTQVEKEHPDDAGLEAELGFWLTASGNPAEALPHLEKAAALRPADARTALSLGLARARLKDLAGAEAEYRRALGLRPGYGSARIALGNLLRRRKDFDAARVILAAAAESGGNEERARALVALGSAQLGSGLADQAASSFERAIEFAPARVEIRLGIGRALLASGSKDDLQRARETLLRAAELAPDLPQVHAALGRVHEKLDDPAAAEESYARAVRLDPGYRFARRRLLRLALDARDLARARAESERLLRDAPEDPEHHFLAALVADRDGQTDEARAHYTRAIAAAKDDYPEAYLNLGLLEKSAGALDRARVAYEKALALRPGYVAAYNNLGKLHAAAGRPAEAEAAFRKALELDRTSVAGWMNLAGLQNDQGRREEAIATYRAALELRPDYPQARLNLGVTYARAGKLDEAIATYRGLVAAEPRYASAWFNLGLALEQKDDLAGARAAYETVRGLDEDHVPSLRKLADLDARAGKLAEARHAYEAVLDLSPTDRTARFAVAELAARQGDRAGCEARARSLQADAPSDGRVAQLLQRCAGLVGAASSSKGY